MSTYMPKAAEVERSWYILDAADKPLGRVAATAAHILRGKHKPTFAPHCDCGDHVIIINCAKAVLTGKKLEKKVYRWHTGWIGHLKEVGYDKLMKENPEKAMTIAVNETACCPTPHSAERLSPDCAATQVQSTTTRLRSPLNTKYKEGLNNVRF